jgi:hypothetical protein
LEEEELKIVSRASLDDIYSQMEGKHAVVVLDQRIDIVQAGSICHA